MGYSKNDNNVAEGLANLIEQFSDKENIRQYLTAFLNQVQDLEDVLNEVLTLTDEINAAFGQQLDNLGSIVGENRNGKSDAQYRTSISARIQLNSSEGTIENVLGLIVAIDPSNAIVLEELFPAGFIATMLNPVDPALIDVNQLGELVTEGRPAGVKGSVVLHPPNPFQYDSGLGYDDGHYGVALGV